MSRKNDPDFTKLVQDQVKLNEETGELTFTNLYANLCLNVSWKKGLIVVPYSHIVWLLKYGRWPLTGYHIDHINDYALDNRPANLQEITEEDNHIKRRGRKIYRNYGSGKYGFGIVVSSDKRSGRYYVSRHLSRGHGKGDLKGIRRSLGGFDTLKEATDAVDKYIAEIKINGQAHLPKTPPKGKKKISAKLDAAMEELQALRLNGLTIREIAKLTGFDEGAVFSRVRNLGIRKHNMRPRSLALIKRRRNPPGVNTQ